MGNDDRTVVISAVLSLGVPAVLVVAAVLAGVRMRSSRVFDLLTISAFSAGMAVVAFGFLSTSIFPPLRDAGFSGLPEMLGGLMGLDYVH